MYLLCQVRHATRLWIRAAKSSRNHLPQIQQSEVLGPHFLSLGMQTLSFCMHENGPLLIGNLAVNGTRIKELCS